TVKRKQRRSDGTVSLEGRGLSWYGDTSTARRLSIDETRLRRARGDLVRAGLLAYASGVYQVQVFVSRWGSPTWRGDEICHRD
ncbi:MAG: hypothetical protein V4631_16160, partial [Pseudomonadota bacterium]